MLAEVVTNLGEDIECNSACWRNKDVLNLWSLVNLKAIGTMDAVRSSRQAAGGGQSDTERAIQGSDGSMLAYLTSARR